MYLKMDCTWMGSSSVSVFQSQCNALRSCLEIQVSWQGLSILDCFCRYTSAVRDKDWDVALRRIIQSSRLASWCKSQRRRAYRSFVL